MATKNSAKSRFLDVWVLETNAVYRQVPFTVVTDWVQQGRLLGEDRLRLSGTEKWLRVADVSAFAAYLPRPEPFRVEDQAEALEPVRVDFSWRHRPADEDDDVDMIPLIDISLVLLIFFMMTAAVGGAGTLIDTPPAQYKLLTVEPETVWVGIDKTPDGGARYSLGKGDAKEGDAFESRQAMLGGLQGLLQRESGPVSVRIRANRTLPYTVVSDTVMELEKLKAQGKVTRVLAEVSEKEGS